MGIGRFIREQKDKLQREYNAHKSRAAWEQKYPDEALKELKQEQLQRDKQHEIRQLKAEARTEKFKAVAGFFAAPTVAAAKGRQRVKVRGFHPEPSSAFELGGTQRNSAFGLGASRESYDLQRPHVFGVSTEKRASKKRGSRSIIIKVGR